MNKFGFNEYDSIRLQNYVRDPKRMGIPGKIAEPASASKKADSKGAVLKKRKSS